MRRRDGLLGGLGLALWSAAGGPRAGLAQQGPATWPDRPVRVLVPFAPGGPTDTLARLFARELQARLGQPVVVENRPGAGGSAGIGAVARAVPDGHTLLVVSAALVINPSLYRSVPYDALRDFAPVTRAATSPNIVVAHPGTGLRTVADLLAEARARPGALSYASPGTGTSPHLAAELLKQRAGVDLLHVPFSGAAPATQALLGRQTDLAFLSLPVAQPHVERGALVPLATTMAERWPGLPAVPTLAEQGFPGFVSDNFQALLAPAGTPAAVVRRLHLEVAGIAAEPAMRETLSRQGYAAIADAPEAFAAHIAQQLPLWAEVIRRGGIRAE